jgi:hypothetical protein
MSTIVTPADIALLRRWLRRDQQPLSGGERAALTAMAQRLHGQGIVRIETENGETIPVKFCCRALWSASAGRFFGSYYIARHIVGIRDTPPPSPAPKEDHVLHLLPLAAATSGEIAATSSPPGEHTDPTQRLGGLLDQLVALSGLDRYEPTDAPIPPIASDPHGLEQVLYVRLREATHGLQLARGISLYPRCFPLSDLTNQRGRNERLLSDAAASNWPQRVTPHHLFLGIGHTARDNRITIVNKSRIHTRELSIPGVPDTGGPYFVAAVLAAGLTRTAPSVALAYAQPLLAHRTALTVDSHLERLVLTDTIEVVQPWRGASGLSVFKPVLPLVLRPGGLAVRPDIIIQYHDRPILVIEVLGWTDETGEYERRKVDLKREVEHTCPCGCLDFRSLKSEKARDALRRGYRCALRNFLAHVIGGFSPSWDYPRTGATRP